MAEGFALIDGEEVAVVVVLDEFGNAAQVDRQNGLAAGAIVANTIELRLNSMG